MLHQVQTQLAVELNCSPDDLNGDQDRVIFTEAKENPGRRPFPRKDRYFEIVTMGRSIVVTATPERLAIAKKQMQSKDRDTIFALPFIRGLWLHYLPDLDDIKPLLPPDNFTYERFERDRIVNLLQLKGFDEALIYDASHPYQTELAMIARAGDKVAGVAGGCKPCSGFWQIGIDILPEYRHCGLAAYLVNRLTFDILNRGDVPNYSTKASHIASQRVAHKAGYSVAWVSDWRINFEGFET
ncbi:MAG: hypothetical protein VB070_12245 [Clostridiaceae bacterium]|nr:hypothetical protein [Clostridiaceae bacterium]